MADRRWLDLARAIAAKAAFQGGDDGVAVDGGQNPVEFDDLHGCPVLLSLSVCQIVPQDHGNDPAGAQGLHFPFGFDLRLRGESLGTEIGRAHVWTPVTNAHLVCSLLLEKKHKDIDDKSTRRDTRYNNLA